MLKEPLLDPNAPWKRRYRAQSIGWMQIASAMPTRGVATSNKTGTRQLYAWDVPGGRLTQLTQYPKGIFLGMISPDGRFIYYMEDLKGDAMGHLFRIPFEGGQARDLTPDMPQFRNGGDFGMSGSGNMIAFTVGDSEGFHLTCIRLGPGDAVGEPKPLYHRASYTALAALSHGGEIAAVTSMEKPGQVSQNMLAFDTATGEQIGELNDEPDGGISFEGSAFFSPIAGDFRIVTATNRTGFNRPVIWNPRTGERIDLTLGELKGDVQPVSWSPDGQGILVIQHHAAVERLHFCDLRTGKLATLQHPPGNMRLATYGPGAEIYALWNDAPNPPRVIVLDGKTGEMKRTTLVAGEVPPGHPWKSITFKSSDGQEIQGWLGLPDGKGPFPTILETHGGPTAVQTNMFAPRSQTWLDHGFAFLTVNYRGSLTFGRDFERKIWGDMGHWEVEDMIAARNWLVTNGIAKPDQILLTGGSYGGYLTLLALGKAPELWAGGMAEVAMADWAAAFHDQNAFTTKLLLALMGGTPEEKPERYAASSAITYAERVKAPVLIIQGRNDINCPARQLELYEAKMKALGKDIDVHWFDAGHGSGVIEKNIDFQERMLRFAYRVLGKRPG